MGSGGVPYRTPTLNQACLARGPRPGPSPTPTPPTVPARPLDFSADSGEREFPPLLVLLVMSLLFCLQTPHHQRNFTFQRLYHFSYSFIQWWPLDGHGTHWWGQAGSHCPHRPSADPLLRPTSVPLPLSQAVSPSQHHQTPPGLLRRRQLPFPLQKSQ